MSKSSLPRSLQQFLMTSRMEAISFLVLVLIAMPLKYMADMPLMVKYVGWAHGVLFVAYVLQLLYVAYKLKWDVLWVIYGGVAALLPFGPFIFEGWIKKK